MSCHSGSPTPVPNGDGTDGAACGAAWPGSRCGPATCMCGPGTQPSLIALRRSTLPYVLPDPMSWMVVNPPSRSFIARFQPRSAFWNSFMFGSRGDGGELNKWTWRSIKPGRTVAWLKSKTRAPAGIGTFGPMSMTLSPLITMI